MEIARGIGNFLLQVGQGVPVHKITLSSILHGPFTALDTTLMQNFSSAHVLEKAREIQWTSEEDYLKRLECLIAVILNTSLKWETQKGLGPVLGEFLSVSSVMGGTSYKYEFTVEQVQQLPIPAQMYRLIGPGFTLGPNEPIDAGKYSPGFGYLDITFPFKFGTYTSKNFEMRYLLPGFRVENLFTASTRNAGYHGDFNFTDCKTGNVCAGSIKKPFKIKGTINTSSGTLLHSFDGDLVEGVFLDDGTLWFSHFPPDDVEKDRLQYVYQDAHLQDPLFSRNVWQAAIEPMKKEDFAAADREKVKIEAAHQVSKQQGSDFIPRFFPSNVVSNATLSTN